MKEPKSMSEYLLLSDVDKVRLLRVAERRELGAEIGRLKDENKRMRGALKTITAYDTNSKFGEGICPYGCDCPAIASLALGEG